VRTKGQLFVQILQRGKWQEWLSPVDAAIRRMHEPHHAWNPARVMMQTTVSASVNYPVAEHGGHVPARLSNALDPSCP
jgi:hypothetical protein